jgi:hypothetical protein
VRPLSFDNIAGFLGIIAMHVCDNQAESDNHFDANQAIVGALTKVLWHRTNKLPNSQISMVKTGVSFLYTSRAKPSSLWDALQKQQAQRTIRRDHVQRV